MIDCSKAWNTIPFRSFLIAAFVLIAGQMALSQFYDADPSLRITLSNIISPIVAGLATYCLILAAARSTGKMRTAWGLMAAALFSAALADITWGILETSLGIVPFPSIADVFYMLFYPLFALGILFMPAAVQSPGERASRLLDTGIIMIAASLIVWFFLISPSIDDGNVDLMTLALSTIYPVADLLLFFAILQVVFQKVPTAIHRPLIFLAISSFILIIADSLFSIMSLKGTFASGGMVDTAYIAGYALIGLAGIMYARSASSWTPSRDFSFLDSANGGRLKSQLILFLPLAGAATAYALLIWSTHHKMPVSLSSLAWGVGGIVGLVLVRQTVLLKENRRLYSSAQSEIEERKQAVEAYRLLVDHSLQGLAIFRDSRILFANQAIADMIGYTVEELLEMPADEVRSLVHPDDRSMVWDRHMDRLKGEKRPDHYEFRVFRKDRSVAWWEMYATVTEYMGRRAIQAAIMDITERKEAEDALIKAKEASDSAVLLKSNFLARMSHEIRTPLTAVLGMSELMLDTSLSDEQREFMETICSSSRSLLLVISDILDLSKIEAGKLALIRQPMMIGAVVEDALDVISSAAANKNLEVIFDMDENVPQEILGDSGRLTQILVNLLGNAIKFTDEGEVQITVAAQKQQGKIEIKFAIKDMGVGIPEDQMDGLFQSFSQADPSVARKYGGTGLGLAISKSLVEMMGGRIWAESRPGVGSTFYFTIMAEEVESQNREVSRYSLKGKRLLIVANSDSLLKSLSRQGAIWGMTVMAVSSGAKAVELMKNSNAFDVVLLDFALTDMNILDLAREIHKIPGKSSVPLLAMKSLRDKESSNDIAEMLIKPIKPSQFNKAIKRSLFAIRKEENGRLHTIDSGMARRYPLRILVAEDNPINLKVVTRTLGRMGYSPDIAISGLEVLDALQVNKYDLILMDIQMPDMDGIEGTKLIRALHPGGQNPRIVAMTAMAMEGDRERCLDAGMDDYLSKPVRVEELAALLERSCTSRKGK